MSFPSEIARFAGNVHGVVVQITASTVAPSSTAPQSFLTPSSISTGIATQIDGATRSSYSTSASASAVLQFTNQRTDLKPNVTRPAPTKAPNVRAISAW